MSKMLELLSGKKTYLLLIAYAVLVLTGNFSGGEISFDGTKLQELVLAGALAALRSGVSKVAG